MFARQHQSADFRRQSILGSWPFAQCIAHTPFAEAVAVKGAVSKYRQPPRQAAAIVAAAFASLTGASRLPSGAPPRPRGVTLKPVLPIRRRFIALPALAVILVYQRLP